MDRSGLTGWTCALAALLIPLGVQAQTSKAKSKSAPAPAPVAAPAPAATLAPTPVAVEPAPVAAAPAPMAAPAPAIAEPARRPSAVLSQPAASPEPTWILGASVGPFVGMAGGSPSVLTRFEATPPLRIKLIRELELTFLLGVVAGHYGSHVANPTPFGLAQSTDVSAWTLEATPCAHLAWRGALASRKLAIYANAGFGFSRTWSSVTTDVPFEGPSNHVNAFSAMVVRFAAGADFQINDQFSVFAEPLGLNVYSGAASAGLSFLFGASWHI